MRTGFILLAEGADDFVCSTSPKKRWTVLIWQWEDRENSVNRKEGAESFAQQCWPNPPKTLKSANPVVVCSSTIRLKTPHEKNQRNTGASLPSWLTQHVLGQPAWTSIDRDKRLSRNQDPDKRGFLVIWRRWVTRHAFKQRHDKTWAVGLD